MNAWTVYWLFKLDDIQTLLMVIAVSSGIVALVATLLWMATYDTYNNDDKKRQQEKTARLLKVLKPTIPLCVVFLTIATFTPGTKTMAAIIVLPRIASAENLDTVSKDAGDIYKLAMGRLKEALGEDKKEAS